MALFEPNNIYTFNTYAPAIYGGIIKNAKLEAVLNYNLAMKRQNVHAEYTSVYPSLPYGTEADPKKVIYYQFLSESGSSILIAHTWVIVATIVGIQSLTATYTITGVNLTDITNIDNYLKMSGFNFNKSIV